MTAPLDRVVLATSNPGKVRELRGALAALRWQLTPLGGLTLPPEDGSTYQENAALKARAVSLQSGLPALADDSGLEVQALNGEPGVYSARFGGRADDAERNLYLLERLRQVPPAQRTATFVSVVVLAYSDGHLEAYRGELRGHILERPRGEGGFGYDPLFEVAGLNRSLAELSVLEKQAVSHRGRALAALIAAHAGDPPG